MRKERESGVSITYHPPEGSEAFFEGKKGRIASSREEEALTAHPKDRP